MRDLWLDTWMREPHAWHLCPLGLTLSQNRLLAPDSQPAAGSPRSAPGAVLGRLPQLASPGADRPEVGTRSPSHALLTAASRDLFAGISVPAEQTSRTSLGSSHARDISRLSFVPPIRPSTLPFILFTGFAFKW